MRKHWYAIIFLNGIVAFVSFIGCKQLSTANVRILRSSVSKASVSKKLNQPKYVVKRNNKAIEKMFIMLFRNRAI
ncbi:hypothetical protein ACIGC1_28630 [Peribacillus butanolivorans]|uniref:hypothetical protein n=1 Tax=Peribacillus butanolivorans TaxID=421767 RepID=UPI0037C84BB1